MGAEDDQAPPGYVVTVSRDVKPIKHRQFTKKLMDFMVPPKKSPEEIEKQNRLNA